MKDTLFRNQCDEFVFVDEKFSESSQLLLSLEVASGDSKTKYNSHSTYFLNRKKLGELDLIVK